MSNIAQSDIRPGETEEDRVERWRINELMRAGYSEGDAITMAARHSGPEAIDLHYAVELVSRGCDPNTAADILI